MFLLCWADIWLLQIVRLINGIYPIYVFSTCNALYCLVKTLQQQIQKFIKVANCKTVNESQIFNKKGKILLNCSLTKQ